MKKKICIYRNKFVSITSLSKHWIDFSLWTNEKNTLVRYHKVFKILQLSTDCQLKCFFINFPLRFVNSKVLLSLSRTLPTQFKVIYLLNFLLKNRIKKKKLVFYSPSNFTLLRFLFLYFVFFITYAFLKPKVLVFILW